MSNHRQQLQDVVRYIGENFIAEVPRNIYQPGEGMESLLEDGEKKSAFQPVTTSLLLLNTCLGNNTLLEGERGTGKSMLASVIGSLVYQIPHEFFAWRKVVGTPGATVNEIYATHDLAELNRGNDVAFLYMPFHAPFLIVDELNRYSELEQNRIREGISTGVWNYANHSWHVPGQVVVSAINPESYGGTFILNDNLIDNYALVLDPAHYNPVLHREVIERAEQRLQEKLGLEEEVHKFMAFYQKHKNEPENVQEKLQEMQQKTVNEYKRRKVPFIHNGFLEQVRTEVQALPLAAEAELFFQSVLAELSYSRKYGSARFDDPVSDDSHDLAYASTKVKESLAGRFLKDWRQISKAIAWYLGKPQAEVEEVKAAFLYTSPRRLKPEEEFYQQVLSGPRKLPVRVELARQLVESCWERYADLSKGESKGFQALRRAIRVLNGEEQGALDEATQTLKQVDHPLAQRVLEAALSEKYKR